MPIHSRHHDQKPPGDGKIAREGRTLRADALADDLDDHFLAATQTVLDRRAGVARNLTTDPLHFAVVIGEILRLQVGDVQETVLLQPEIDERRLNARFDVGDAPLVDIAYVRGRRCALDEQLFQPPLVNHRHTALLPAGHVDEHDAPGSCVLRGTCEIGRLWLRSRLLRRFGSFRLCGDRRLVRAHRCSRRTWRASSRWLSGSRFRLLFLRLGRFRLSPVVALRCRAHFIRRIRVTRRIRVIRSGGSASPAASPATASRGCLRLALRSWSRTRKPVARGRTGPPPTLGVARARCLLARSLRSRLCGLILRRASCGHRSRSLSGRRFRRFPEPDPILHRTFGGKGSRIAGRRHGRHVDLGHALCLRRLRRRLWGLGYLHVLFR